MLNNGITITAQGISVDETNSGKRFLFTVDNFESEFRDIKSYEQKYFYVLFIVEKYNKSISEAIPILENLIDTNGDIITETRLLLKAKFKEKLVEQLKKKEEFSFF